MTGTFVIGSGRQVFLACVLACTQLTRAAYGGGGPENVFVVVNTRSWASKTIANYFCHLRRVPASNIFYLDRPGSNTWLTVDAFREVMLDPILKEVDKRGLGGQIDYIVYSSDYPYEIRFDTDLPQPQRFASGSITGLTYLAQWVQAEDPRYTGNVNWYMRMPRSHEKGYTLIDGNVEAATRGFRSTYQWGPAGEQVENGGQHYLLSTMLAYTSGRGNSVAEAIRYLQRSAWADGTHPTGSMYFMLTPETRPRPGAQQGYDIRATTRQPAFESAGRALRALGINAEIVSGQVLPQGRNDVLGILAGTRNFDVASSRSTIAPGAICENFTSFGGALHGEDRQMGQTRLSEFLRFGAAGSSGTVVEPYASWTKFPHPMMYVHYARGCTLAEAYYQSVFSPYQLLVVGDPLCRPWATIPIVTVDGVRPGDRVSANLVLKPDVQSLANFTPAHFELFVDGRRVDQCAPGDQFEFDTQSIGDGHHELRIVAVEADLIQSQGRLIVPVLVDNQESQLVWKTEPRTDAGWERPIMITARCKGAEGIAIVQGRRLVGRIDGDAGQVRVNPQQLGYGPVTLQAVALKGAGPRDRVFGKPLQLNIKPPAPLRALRGITRFSTFRSVQLRTAAGTEGPIGKANDRDWLAKAGVKLNESFEIVGDIYAPEDDVYQFELELAGSCEIRVDDMRLFNHSSDTNQHYYVPVSLQRGKHRIRLRGTLRKTLKFFLAFGNRGTSSIGSDQFKPRS